MKTLFSILFILPLIAAAQQYPENDRQLQFARDVFSRISLKDYEVASDRYLVQRDFEAMLKQLDRKRDQTIVQRETEKYDEKKQRFADKFKSGLNGDIDWKLAHIDSIRYAYEIKDIDRQDPKIEWPLSKEYQPTGKEMVCNRTSIYFSDGKHAYVMTLESLYYNKQWWFFHTVRTPRILMVR